MRSQDGLLILLSKIVDKLISYVLILISTFRTWRVYLPFVLV